MVVPSRRPSGLVTTTLIGVVGAVAGGQLWNATGPQGTTGMNLDSNFVALETDTGRKLSVGIEQLGWGDAEAAPATP